MGFVSNKRVGSCVQPPQPRCGHSARAKMRECGYVPRKQIGFGIVPRAKIGMVSDSWGNEGNAGGAVEDEMDGGTRGT
jgi:hypothetical protein